MRPLSVLLLAVVLCAGASAADATLPSRWTEDFSTAARKDPAVTTAAWDTVSGRLHLWPLAIDQIGAFDTPGTAYDVVLAGDLAYVADYDLGLRIVSLADPTAPVEVGAYDSPGYTTDIWLHPPYAFLSDGGGSNGGVRIVDVSDPSAPTSPGSFLTVGYVNEVAVQGDVAAVAIGASGVQFINIADPAAPVSLGTIDTPGYAYALAYVGRYVYVADGTTGMLVIDALNPAAPVQVGAYDTDGSAYDVLVAGRRAYVADYARGVVILDLPTPTTPVLLGLYDTPGQARALALDGSFLQVADGTAGIEVLDVTNPAAPVLVQASGTAGTAYDVAIDAELTLVADGLSGLQVLRHRRLTVQPFVHLQGVEGSYQLMQDMVLDGRLAYLTGYGGTLVEDVSDPEVPVQIGSFPGGGEALDVAGTLACVVSGESGLVVVNVGDPAHPAQLGSLALPGTPQDVVIDGRYAYVACGNAGVQVVNLAVPTAPALVGAVVFTGNCMSLELAGDRVYVAAQHGGLQVIDVTDPLHPAQLGGFMGNGNVVDVAVAGRYAYVVEFYGDIVRKLDVSNPADIVEVGSAWLSQPRRIAVSGHLAAIVTGNTELILLEAGDNGFGSYLEQQSGLSPFCVAFCGDYLLTGDQEWSPYVPYEFAQRWRDPERNVGQGLLGSTGQGYAMKVRLTSTQWNGWAFSQMYDNVFEWYLVNNAGSVEQPIYPDGQWYWLDQPAWSLGWRATCTYTLGREGPYIDSLALDVLRDLPIINAVADVPEDQGGQVRLRWTRSAYDDPESDYPVTEYSVYRRVDDPLLVAGKAAAGVVPDPRGASDKAWPPGEWDYLVTVPADGEDSYSVVVPTLSDSTTGDANRATFFVRARTWEPGVLFDAPPDSGCSVDNLAPPVPRSLMVSYTVGGNLLAWGAPDAIDVARYRVYRGAVSDFVPAPESLLAETTSTAWIDRVTSPWDWFYKVAAVDVAGNEGPAAVPDAVTGVADPRTEATPSRFALHGATPNPFNPRTTIRYDVPAAGGDVRLELYDARGRLVRTLVAGRQAAGRQATVWDGRDDAGRRVPSGVYFARLRATGCDAVVKLTLAG
ncbi:MAG: LVIVD repeat-containing protein [Candidatus Krumholzibacteriia bacterium]